MSVQHTEQWIWLPEERYPYHQTTVISGFHERSEHAFTVAEFVKKYKLSKKIVRAELRFCADTAYRLTCNGSLVATGPACVGGDFIGNETVRGNYYYSEAVIFPETDTLDFFARVKLSPVQICEYSKGRGGFMLSAVLTLEDGTQESVFTDESWLARRNGAYTSPLSFDGRLAPDAFVNAEITEDIWHAEQALIPVRDENELFAENGTFTLAPKEKKDLVLELDKVWAGFLHVSAKTVGEVELRLMCRETDEKAEAEKVIFNSDGEYIGFYMHSAGNIAVASENKGDAPAEITVSFIETHYPVPEEATTSTSDDDINLVLETCKHTLRICRQTHHLDSPRHCEPMACTGDYNIESMMTPFAFGDMRLAEFDLIRTAVMLEREDGRMFHTTYSLIWVKMLYDVYMFTGNADLLKKCEKALRLLLRRFESYVGSDGLVEKSPDYMFVDWIYIDGISMHHPPKALGQTCLNMFYFAALDNAERIYRILGDEAEAVRCAEKRENLRVSINSLLYDKEKGVYIMGLNTFDEMVRSEWKWTTPNTDKRYYLKHANVLAACFGVCDDDTARVLIRKVAEDEIEGECQPYFLHYFLEAVYRHGLREKYTLKIIEKWKKPVRECPKGLVEGFIPPEPTYSFDHSHAWGGTPLYSLPKALMGLEIVSAGMTEISLSPSLLGLDYVRAELLTVYGKVVCEMKSGEEPKISAPKEVKITIR